MGLEEQSLIRKSSRLGEDSRDGKHSKSTILDLSLSVSLGLIGIRRELKGIESEISRLTSRTLGLIEDGSTTSELQNEHSSEEETHAAIGHAGIVGSKGELILVKPEPGNLTPAATTSHPITASMDTRPCFNSHSLIHCTVVMGVRASASGHMSGTIC